MYTEDDLLPLSALQHIIFCRRQCALGSQGDGVKIQDNDSMIKSIAKALFCIAMLFVFPLTLNAFVEPPTIEIIKPVPTATYYIDAAAGDGGDGSLFAPWNDIMDANNKVQPGALIKIRGTFTGPDSIQTWSQSGMAGNEIVFEPWGDAVAVIEFPLGIGWNGSGNNIIIDGGPDKKIIFDGHALVNKYNLQTYGNNVTFYRIKSVNNHKDAGLTTGTNISITGGDGIRIINSEVSGCPSVGIYPQRGVNIEIRNNIIRDNGGTGIQFNPHFEDLAVENVVVSGNAIYNNGAITDRSNIIVTNTGIYDTTYVNNVVIANNLIWGSAVAGIAVGERNLLSKVGGVKIYNNTIYANTISGIWINKNNESYSNPIIANNIIYANGSDLTGGNGEDCVENNNLTIDPLFLSADLADNNFLMITESSPAKDSGLDVGIITDYSGSPRPWGIDYDIGAYEYINQAGQTDTTAPGAPNSLHIE